MNRVALTGRLTQDPDLRYTQGGTAVGNLRVAVDRPSNEDEADFFDVVAFGKVAENVASYMEKGRRIGIDGRLRQDRWTTSEGDNRSKVRVVANAIEFLD